MSNLYTNAYTRPGVASAFWLLAATALAACHGHPAVEAPPAALVADHDGMITSESADTGQYVSAGQAVYGLAWSGDIDVNLDAAAGDLGRMTIGQPADVMFSALPGRRFAA